jgi:hypothetical protein
MGDWVERSRWVESYPVLTTGTKGLPKKTRRSASSAFSPFFRDLSATVQRRQFSAIAAGGG